MRKKLYLVLFCLGILALQGCMPQAHTLMSPVQYKKPITFHVAKKAYIYWGSGAQYAHELPVATSAGAGIIATTIVVAIDAHSRKNNPSKYNLLYGDAQQAVFITSLKDILKEHHVFEDAEIITDQKIVKPGDVLINITFELTHVLENTKIILDVKMSIYNENNQFERTYFIQNDKNVNGFKDKQINVSEKLMRKIISGIKQWSKQGD